MMYDVPAPAKLNLFLHVVGRRPDGYHLLQTAFRFIDLCDTLHFDSRTDGRIERLTDLPGVLPEHDLTVRAAKALQQATGVRQGVSIALEKRIPQGGGLGGGSSDAASTLIALNRLWGTGLSRKELMALALPLGADVPVFVFGQSAFAEGVGEILSPLNLPDASYLVAQPHVSVPTANIFSDPDLTRDSSLVTIADFLASQSFDEGSASQDSPKFFGRNDLESVVYRRYPEVNQAAQWLTEQGLTVRMSGSGACLFAQFSKKFQDDLPKQKISATMRVASELSSNPQKKFRLIKFCLGLSEHPLRNWIAS